jgi:hypothetical protein
MMNMGLLKTLSTTETFKILIDMVIKKWPICFENNPNIHKE